MMDVVAHYSPPTVGMSSVHASASPRSSRGAGSLLTSSLSDRRGTTGGARLSPGVDGRVPAQPNDKHSPAASPAAAGNAVDDEDDVAPSSTTTFNRSVQIALMEPVGSMSLSPANRDVVLAARKGLFIVDLENPYDQPRFLPHLTTWVPADVQWNPHPARANWVASTSNNKLLVWNLDRPAALRSETIFSGSTSGSMTGVSPSTSMGRRYTGLATPSSMSGTLPRPPAAEALAGGADLSTSRLSSISHVLHAHTRAITDINWSPFHPEILASCGIDTWTWAWDLREPSRPKQGYSAWNAAMTQVKWNRATQHRLATSCDNKVLIWDDRKGALPLATIEAHENKIYGVDWSRDTSLGLSRLVTCSLDGSVKWWDLDSPAAQNAIGQSQLVTESETTIETQTPVWRARHLPFGQGVMTLPQRGDTSLSMWAKDHIDAPVHRFEGHSDIVKEYLIRTRGGNDRNCDDRQFQLITWSKDQTLRLWPISQELTKAVGHKPSAPIRVLQTRAGARDVTYRMPPPPAEQPVDIAQKTASIASATPQSPSSFAAPTGATRSLLTGAVSKSAHGSLRVLSPSASPQSLSPSEQRDFRIGSLGRHLDKRDASARSSQGGQYMTMSDARGTKRSGTAISALKPMSAGSKAKGGSNARFDGSMTSKEASKRDGKAERPRHLTQQNPSRGFMTRGALGRPGQGRIGAAQKGNALRMDAVGWIAGVRMGQELPAKRKEGTTDALIDDMTIRGDGVPDHVDVQSASDAETHTDTEGGAEEQKKDAAQILGEEIMTVSKRVNGIDFEKIDVSARTCAVTCYGPWAGHDVPCFVRITMTFPNRYPARPPRFELEHNASVALKTRAFLIRNINAILADCAKQEPPLPSMEGVMTFLTGENLAKTDRNDDNDRNTLPHWLLADDADDSAEEADTRLIDMKMPPRRCGATFARNGTLVVFSPSSSAIHSGNLTRAPSTSHQSDAHRAGISGGGARFLQSYTALAGAMGSLARLAKDGVTVQDLDVVQLMSDQDFFAKRLQTQNDQQRGLSSKPGSVLPSSAQGRIASAKDKIDDLQESRLSAQALLQSRLKLMTSSSARRPSRVRPASRTRSASPRASREAYARGHFGQVLSGFAKTIPGIYSHANCATADATHSQILLYDVSSVLGIPSAPPLLRRRSNSLPASPAQLTPRAEISKRLGFPLAVPESLRRASESEEEPASISASRTRADGETRPDLPPNVRIMEMSAADAANFLPSVVADGSGTLFSHAGRGGRDRRDDDSEDGYGAPSDDHGSDSDDSDLETSDDDEMTAEQLMRESQREGISPTAERVLDTMIWTIPFGFVYLMLDVMIQQQYASHPSIWSEVKRMAQAMPVLTAFIYYTAIKPAQWRSEQRSARVALQLFLFAIGTSCGCGNLYVYARSPNDVVQRRTAPLGTLWMYSVVKLDLSLVVLSLAIVYGYTKYHNLPLFD